MEKNSRFFVWNDTLYLFYLHNTHFFRKFKFVELDDSLIFSNRNNKFESSIGDYSNSFCIIFLMLPYSFQPDIVPTFGLQQDLVLIVAPVIGGVLVVAVMFVGFVICVATVKKKRSLHGTYSPQKQEFSAPRFEMTDMSNVFKLPAEERLIWEKSPHTTPMFFKNCDHDVAFLFECSTKENNYCIHSDLHINGKCCERSCHAILLQKMLKL